MINYVFDSEIKKNCFPNWNFLHWYEVFDIQFHGKILPVVMMKYEFAKEIN